MKHYNDTIQSLDRGLGILDYLSRREEPVPLRELTSYSELDKSTVYRIMKTLVRRGYARQDEKTKEYSLGPKVFDLSRALATMLSLEKEVAPFLKDLMVKTGETAYLAVLLDGMATYIGKESSHEVLTINSEVGRREPLHCTAIGKVLFAYLSEDEFQDIIDKDKFAGFTMSTITKVIDLREELDKVRKRGYAVDDEEYKPGVRCVASPVYNSGGTVIAAIGISGPGSRVTRKKLPGLSRIVVKAASNLSAHLGFEEV